MGYGPTAAFVVRLLPTSLQLLQACLGSPVTSNTAVPARSSDTASCCVSSGLRQQGWRGHRRRGWTTRAVMKMKWRSVYFVLYVVCWMLCGLALHVTPALVASG